ncbi:MAG: glycerophosphodiester phosphodiesterase family protein [Niabella sp.]
MLDRRSFLNSGIWVAGVPLLGGASTTGSSKGRVVKGNAAFYLSNNVAPRGHETYYISHRGVHLKQRVAGENTIESLRLAKRAGFQCVEFDVRFTSDGKAVVIHDETINRTLRDLRGNKLQEPVYVKDLTFKQLRSEYEVYTENAKAKTIVPTFEEYVQACGLYRVIPFVEIKDAGISKEQYDDLLHYLDAVIGRENYVITSNNKVNDRLRDFGYNDVMVMGILYQTTFAHIQSWKHAIMAISASRFTAVELNKNVLAANEQGILTESHADTPDKYNLIIQNGIDFISTDLLMPEYTGYGQVIDILDWDNEALKELDTDGIIAPDRIALKPGNYLGIEVKQYRHFFLYGATLEIVFSGKCKCLFKKKEYELTAVENTCFRYPVLLHKETFELKIKATEACTIRGLRVTLTKF